MNAPVQKTEAGDPGLRIARTFVLLVFTFTWLSAPTASAQCQHESRRRGNVTAVDLGLAQLTVHSNDAGGIDQVFQTDSMTEFRGSVGFLFEIQLGDEVDIDYCSGNVPAYAVRVDVSPPTLLPAGALIVDLDVPHGSESVPLQRIFGDDGGDALGHTVFGDYNGDGYSDLLVQAGRPGVLLRSKSPQCLRGLRQLAILKLDHRSVPRASDRLAHDSNHGHVGECRGDRRHEWRRL